MNTHKMVKSDAIIIASEIIERLKSVDKDPLDWLVVNALFDAGKSLTTILKPSGSYPSCDGISSTDQMGIMGLLDR